MTHFLDDHKIKRYGKALRVIIVGLFVVMVGLTGCGPQVEPYSRAGFGLSTSTNADKWAGRLGAGWFLDWNTRERPFSRQPEYWQMVRLSKKGTRPGMDEIVRLAKWYPGQVWVIGNEPDNSLQDNIPPDVFAVMYHDLYTAIKEADSKAKIAVGGVSQPSQLRLRYLELMLDEYKTRYGTPLPVDWWTVHGYVLREEHGAWGAGIPVGLADQSGLIVTPAQHGDTELFKQQIIDFRAGMKNNGYQDVPLALTEFGILLPERLGYSSDTVGQYLTATFEWLDVADDPAIGYPADEYRLVQKWAWFSLGDKTFPIADLVNLKDGGLTPAGKAFQAFVISRGLDN
jgi:hypothetical protein